MFRFSEDFSVVNDDKMPYSLREENIHPYISTPSARVENKSLLILRNNARLLFNTPKIGNFEFSCLLGYLSPASAYGKHTNWSIYFGYDEKRRTGKMFSISYYEKEALLNLSVRRMNGKTDSEEDVCRISNISLEPDKQYLLKLTVGGGICSGTFDGIEFSLNCAAPLGKIGLMSKSTVNGLTFSEVEIVSEDTEPCKALHSQYVIPHFDGGSEDYLIDIEAKKFSDSITEISYSLTGGAFSRKNDSYNMVIWSVQYDVITNPYIRFLGKGKSPKLYIKNGELVFVEQCPDGKNAELVIGGQSMPYSGRFYIEDFDENSDFAFGYDMFRRLGNELSEDEREFIYRDGKLLYSGKSLSEDYVISVASPSDKKIAGMIPQEIDEYEKALFHAQNNHYFMNDEQVSFHVSWHLRKNRELIDFKAYLLDAFFDEIYEIDVNTVLTDKFAEYGISTFEGEINLKQMAQGVYHVKLVMLLGSEAVCTHVSAFEVIDGSDVSPRESSGIPFMYSGEAAPPNIKYNCPDPWTIKPDHNEIHYLDCLLAVPKIAEFRKGWEILKLYKRKMFLWLNSRTISRGETYLDYPESIKNADYINISDKSAFINYLILKDSFNYPSVRDAYKEFRESNPQYNLFQLSDDRKITDEEFRALLSVCGSEWIDYFCEKHAQRIVDFHEKIKKQNPLVKFSTYGPYALYGTYNSGILAGKWRMVAPEKAHEMMDGFWIFEDYPFITGKATHYSCFGMMGLLLKAPRARILVELFGSFDPVCPDGAVCYAFPPMGGCYVEPYRTLTQVYEHMYAAVLTENGFKYYKKPAFQFLQSYNTEAKRRFEIFLKGWGRYLKNKPQMPMKSPVFLMEYTNQDDRFEIDFAENNVNNVSQAAQAYIYGIMAESGLPKGYCADFGGIMKLDESMTDVCVLPSLAEASDEVKAKIRSLSESGVALVAVSDVSNLEDLFGVERCLIKDEVCLLKNESESESIATVNAEFFYKEKGAETLLCAQRADGKAYPAVMKYGKNIIVNSYVCQIGCEDFPFAQFGLSNVSRLLKSTLEAAVKEICEPLATATNTCGISLFINEAGERRILLTDYSLCGAEKIKNVLVKLNFEAESVDIVGCSDLKPEVNLIRKCGKIKAFSVKMRPGDSMILAVE